MSRNLNGTSLQDRRRRGVYNFFDSLISHIKKYDQSKKNIHCDTYKKHRWLIWLSHNKYISDIDLGITNGIHSRLDLDHRCSITITIGITSVRGWKPIKINEITRLNEKVSEYEIHNRIVKVFYPPQLLDNILNSKSRFVVVFINLSVTKDPDGHQNVVIIDTVNNEFERFEQNRICKIYDEFVDAYFQREFLPSKFRYITTPSFSKGIQINSTNSREIGGYCVAICLFYVHMRLANIHYTREDVVDYIESFTRDERHDIILRYIHWVETTIPVIGNNSKSQLFDNEYMKNFSFTSINNE